ncbi:MAG: hypothetical protein HY308_03205 [Gammaproteobacteria bacterium]|nr:hypothetical protein [Gammaproteobacteria bacterium]
MKVIDTLTHVTGLCVLLPNGGIGFYQDNNAVVLDAELSQALTERNQEFLAAYLAAPHAEPYRLGLIFAARERRPWGVDTFVLEERVVREVYPVSGAPTAELTSFQKKNREKSLYRGIELLLDYRLEHLADAPVYCPVLYDRGTTLGQYPAALHFGEDADRDIPVLEVVNLVATMPMAHRNVAAVLALMKRMYERTVHKDMRDQRLAVIGKVGVGSEQNSGFFDANTRHERKLTLAVEDMPAPVENARAQLKPATGFAADKQAPAAGKTQPSPVSIAELQVRLNVVEPLITGQRVAAIERLLSANRLTDVSCLSTFLQFQNIAQEKLALLAEKLSVYRAPAGTQLLALGANDPWNLYLLQGAIALRAADGGATSINGGSDKAKSPIASLKPRKYSVTAVTSVSFLWIHDTMVQAVTQA